METVDLLEAIRGFLGAYVPRGKQSDFSIFKYCQVHHAKHPCSHRSLQELCLV